MITRYREEAMEIEVTFPGGKRVDAKVGAFTIHTDQPVEAGGAGSATGPFELFLASLATCAGYYALAFCQGRSLPTEGLGLTLRYAADGAGIPTQVLLELRLPFGFPEGHRAAMLRAVGHCKVKRTVAAAPSIKVALV
jgi:putative redox protein